ncbi:hypothetical protein DIPPA_34938 [Diplonema papillatum]|nr:hypothetical protein DIPPA_34938 [Diplonema papillatum]
MLNERIYDAKIRDLESKYYTLSGADRARAVVIEVLRERDAVVEELREALATINTLRDTVEKESNAFSAVTIEQQRELDELRRARAEAEKTQASASEAIDIHETQSARMQRHIDGLCKELEELQKKWTATEATSSTASEDLARLERLKEEAETSAAVSEARRMAAEEAQRVTEADAAELRKTVKLLEAELGKVAGFQQLLADETSRLRPKPRAKAPSRSALHRSVLSIPPDVAGAVQYLSKASPAVKYAFARAPLPAAGGGSSRDEAALEKFRWASPSLNNKASIFSKYYVNG